MSLFKSLQNSSPSLYVSKSIDDIFNFTNNVNIDDIIDNFDSGKRGGRWKGRFLQSHRHIMVITIILLYYIYHNTNI